MRTHLRVLFTASALVLVLGVSLVGCSIFPKDMSDRVRWSSQLVLTGYEATQQAVLIYGRLPHCDHAVAVVKLCRDRALWARIKQYDAAAVAAIVKAQPVLNGTVLEDNGDLAAAYQAIANVRDAMKEANTKLVTDVPLVPQPEPGT